ncbi:M14 family metallopeptidase [Streptomyces sp. H27-D2]|uniref:M14 family metallopeptidase n=1 Tax=Streptomyces sp. H27-D2 TaxID=3046304 RepID=UPI002DB59BE6|nr:M14 family zinc carboxypeptidase [Streptomyces sp. H27-D2]MEC4019478.1 M14 family zinc carboxypeptidase [Streptomyces sp. H27-D2]
MRRKARSILAAASLLIGGMAAAPVAQAQNQAQNQVQDQPSAERGGAAGDTVSTWTAEVTRAQIPLLLAAGADGHELGERAPAKGTAEVELYLTGKQAAGLRGQGVQLTKKTLSEKARNRVEAAGDGVYRPYGAQGGLMKEIIDTNRAHPGLTKVVNIGKTVQGKDILALKISKGAAKTADGKKPAVLYMSNQHAREWITPEMTRRLMHYYIGNYGKNDRVTKIVDRTELWFVLSANPDGYDYTFGPGHRQWRKNLRDNNGDGAITPGDGVDLNRNFAYKWGYDNEGSSPQPGSETYRGQGPMSEPETKAIDAFQKRVGFEYGINYHSAAELLLYGVGWQVATDTPDDVLYKSLAGTPENSAIPGYHPQVSSELYTTNGEADGHAANVNGMMMFTPEMSTCATASRIDPNDPWNAADCASVFTFPDDEKLIQQEFAKNIPFALSVAETAQHPDQPSSSVGIDAPDFTPAAFTASYARGADQEVAVTARKSVRDKRLNYRIDGGRTHTERLAAWKGGETYGGDDNLRFDQYRAEVEDAEVGDKVDVWFTGRTRGGKRTASDPFRYTVAERPRADTLVIAEEGGTGAAQQLPAYTRALADNHREAAVWDVGVKGAPSALGVLSHFKTVLWYSGANKPGGATLLAVRDFLNEGGKLITTGEQAGGSSRVGPADTDDFSQYYLGADGRISLKAPPEFGGAGKLAGAKADLAGAAGNPLDAAGAYTVTSDSLPPAQFPQFRSSAAGEYPGVRTPFQPYEGDWFAAAVHRDNSWMRLARTVDLSGTGADAKPSLDFMLSYDTEGDYDNVIVEAHTVGQDDWTTLPDAKGGTTSEVPAECAAGFYVNAHPFLARYLTVGDDDCLATGSSGGWNRFTGSSDGWRPVSFDLSGYAGKKVELSVSYVSDPGTGGRGVFVDNTRLVTGGTGQGAEGFETSLGPWTVPGPPAGSPANTVDWARSKELFRSSAAVTTRDTVLLGFGLEHVRTARERAALLGAALRAVRD